MANSVAHSAFARVNQLAAQRAVHGAFQWLHLHEKQIMDWQTEMVAVAAPPFGERPRAEWLAERFRELELENVHLDDAGNVLGTFAAHFDRGIPEAVRPCVLLSAHIDTVFPIDTPILPIRKGNRLEAPGACDNAAGVAGLLAVAAALKNNSAELPCDLLFCGNVGEEGEGDLRGIRYLYQRSSYGRRIASHLVLDGSGHEVAVTQALGSRRFLVSVTGPGGHSWTDSDAPNPIAVLCRAVSAISSVYLPADPRTTMNIGTITGGTSVNSVPEEASARFDIRSTDPDQILRIEVELHRAVEDAVLEANQKSANHATTKPTLTKQSSTKHTLTNPTLAKRAATGSAASRDNLHFTIRKIGDRPAAQLATNSAIFEALRAVDRHLGIRTEARIGSTDANIPLSLGIEAMSIGAGGDGANVHTRAEWYDATNRALGLRRVLLLTLAMLENGALLP